MNQTSRILQSKKIFNKMVKERQKGFKKNIEGCTEHAATINFLMADAIARRRNIYIATLDCRDAFGSVSHDLLRENLTRLEVPEFFRNTIMDSYDGATVEIFTNTNCTPPIKILRGVKQGCPLSPLLFNICIDPVFNYLQKCIDSNQREGLKIGYKTETLGNAVAQAYADDMVLVSETPDGLQFLIDATKRFLDFADIKLNTKKCEVLKYEPKRTKVKFKFNDDEIEPANENQYVKYLGVPLGSKRVSKYKFAREKIKAMIEYVDKIQTSGLSPNQIIHAVKTFIIPKIHYICANSIIAQTDLKLIDSRIRKAIYSLIKGQKLPKHYIYGSWKDGGLGISKVQDIYDTYKLHHIAHLLKTDHGRRILKGDLSLNELPLPEFHRLNRRVEVVLKKLNIKWVEWEKFKEQDDVSKYNSVYYYNNNRKLQTKFQDLTSKKFLTCNLKSVNAASTNRKQRQQRKLLWTRPGTKDLSLMENTSNVSNFYFNNNKSMINEAVIRFLIKARSGTLWTPQRLNLIFKSKENDGLCKRCGKAIGTLSHILNSCEKSFDAMTDRHNDVVKIMAQSLKQNKNEMLNLAENKDNKYRGKYGWNSRIRLPFPYNKKMQTKDFSDQEMDEDIKQRPDLWFYRLEEVKQNKVVSKVLRLHLIEVTVPFGAASIEFAKNDEGKEDLYADYEWK
jgi:hypothetical protein